MQPRRATAQDVELKGEVVFVVRSGGRRPSGFAVRWQDPADPVPLARLVRDAALKAARDDVAAPSLRDTLLDYSGTSAYEALAPDGEGKGGEGQ